MWIYLDLEENQMVLFLVMLVKWSIRELKLNYQQTYSKLKIFN